MKQVLAATGLAAIVAVGLAAQSTTGTSGTAQDPQTTTGGQRGNGPRTVTGCVRAGDTAGTYVLTNVEGMGGRRDGDTTGSTTAGGTTTGGTTTGGTTTAGTSGDQTGRGPGGPMTLMLTADSSVDLKTHVGHKVEVTGTIASGGRRGGDTTSTATGTATSTATGTATSTGTTATGGGQSRYGRRTMTVTLLKMVSDSCS